MFIQMNSSATTPIATFYSYNLSTTKAEKQREEKEIRININHSKDDTFTNQILALMDPPLHDSLFTFTFMI